MIARSLSARLAASVIAAGVLLVSTTGCTLFTTQATYLPYRVADPRDVLSNGLGGLLGATLVGLVRSLLPERRRRRRLHPRTA